MRPLAYKIHPYRWPAIGRDMAHIKNINIDQVKDFFFSHYAPNNAIMSLTGNIGFDLAYKLSERWFGPIAKREVKIKKPSC